MSDLDSDRDDVPRRFRRTSSCGPERTCGAEDCSSCYPGGPHRDEEREADEDEDEPTSEAMFADLAKILDALKFALIRPTLTSTATALVGQAQRNLVIALEKLDDERLTETDKAKADNLIYHEWHRRMLAAETELATLRYVHRPVEVTP